MTRRGRSILVAASLLGLLPAGCGSTAKPTSSPPPTVTRTTATGARLAGADYSLNLAPGWHVVTRRHTTAARVDLEAATKTPRAVLLVALLKAPAGVSAAKALRDQARSELAGVHATASTRPRPLTLDGARAITYEYRSVSPQNARIQTRQVLVIHGGELHGISVTAGRAQFTAIDTAFGTMLNTWRWSGPTG